MPFWPSPTDHVVDRARAAHQQRVGAPTDHVASAPATWLLIGEHVDHYGGIVAAGLSDIRAAAAVSPRDDSTITVSYRLDEPDAPQVRAESTTLDTLSQLAAAQQSGVDEAGQPVPPPFPTGGLAERFGGVVSTMISRQLLSRETTGLDITVVTDIPAYSGLGGLAAADVAVALALLGGGEDPHDAPLRARLAEVCSQAVDVFAALPALRARHTAALRGNGEQISIIDYADGSVTQASHPLGDKFKAFIVTVPDSPPAPQIGINLRIRQRFIDNACHAFGTESLRLLPDATQRVLDWLDAVHEVYPDQDHPAHADAARWLSFYATETDRALGVARSLRSRRGADLWPLLHQSQSALGSIYQLPVAAELAELVTARGAIAARSAAAGVANAVIAYVPAEHAHIFSQDLADDGLRIVPLRPGKPAS